MGLFSKIEEMIRRIRTPKLEAGKNYQQNQYQDTKNMNYLQQPYTIKLSNNGEELILTSIEFNKEIKHRNGEVTKLMIAKAFHQQERDYIFFNQEESIAFEVPAGVQINDVILQKIGSYYMYERNMPDCNKECMYLGSLSQYPYDLGTNNKSETVNKYINEKIEPQIARQKQEQIERQIAINRERIEREENESARYRRQMNEKYKEYKEGQNQIRTERIKRPYLKQVSSEYIENEGKQYYDYDGVNVINGDILKLRKINKVGIDENGTYVYTGYIDTTPNENDVEMFSRDEMLLGVPVCFATNKKIEEIMRSNNPNDLKGLLTLLSNEDNFKNNNGYLNYIGMINNDNKIDKNIGNRTRSIQSTVTKLQEKFYQERTQGQER